MVSSKLVDRMKSGLLAEIKWLERRGFKPAEPTVQGRARWKLGRLEFILCEDLSWLLQDSEQVLHGTVCGENPVVVLTRLREMCADKSSSLRSSLATTELLCAVANDVLEWPRQKEQSAADSAILRIFRGRTIPQECCRRIDELEREGWTPVKTKLDYLAWARDTVLKTLRYDEGSGWIWGTHENPFKSEGAPLMICGRQAPPEIVRQIALMKKHGYSEMLTGPRKECIAWTNGKIVMTLHTENWRWDVDELQECECANTSPLEFVPEEKRIPVQEDNK